jgi:hypothetical protein
MTEKPKDFQTQANELLGHYRQVFTNSPAVQDVLADVIGDLFVIGDSPQQQERANKCLELLERLGVIQYVGGKPTMESMRKIIEKLLRV